MKLHIRKITSSDAGYNTVQAVLWPRLVFGCYSRRPNLVACLPTHKQAVLYAYTGEVLELSPMEKWELRQRQQQDPWMVAHYDMKRAKREASKAR